MLLLHYRCPDCGQEFNSRQELKEHKTITYSTLLLTVLKMELANV